VGLNLTAAGYVFILDPWWNPAAELQALNRAHRIGQNKNVFVYRFISENTIEEKIQRLQARKKELANSFISSNNPLKDISEKELLELFS
jgi:SNF2 family DNA or RNA helicase